MKYDIKKFSQPKPSNLVTRLVDSLTWADRECPPLDEKERTTHFERMIATLREHPQMVDRLIHTPSSEESGGYITWVAHEVKLGTIPTYEFFMKVISNEVKEGRIEKKWLNHTRWRDRVFPTEAAMKAVYEASAQAWEDALIEWGSSNDHP